MKLESIVFAVAGACFGVIVGWILASQQASPVRTTPPAESQTARPPGESSSGRAATLDEAQVRALRRQIERDPKNASTRVRLGNLYFDAERYEDSVAWYEAALMLDPKDVNVSTDLGVSYYYLNEPDRALKQFDYSLALDPRHTKTILNVGIVKAFGKQDLEGAADAWRRVIQIAPDSPEAQAAKRALDSMRAAHPGLGGGSSPGGK